MVWIMGTEPITDLSEAQPLKPPIGLLGGTFDPIHLGHLRPALEICQQLKLAQVRFIPNRYPPHKPHPNSTDSDRLEMLRRALAGQPEFAIDTRELKRDKPSYTIDTLIELRRELPDTPLCFIMGMDSLVSLASWHRWRELGDYAHLVVCHRPGWQPDLDGELAEWAQQRRCQHIDQLGQHTNGLLLLCQVSQLEIASSSIRAGLASGLSPRYLLPDNVLEYIELRRLYR